MGADPWTMEDGGPEGAVLVDRRRPGRHEVSPALVPLLRRPTAAQKAATLRDLRAYEARAEHLPAPVDPVRVAGVLAATAFCAASWFLVLRLLLAL